MIEQKIGLQCTACSACSNICPKSAIEMRSNGEGFFYPEVNDDLCISCGACVRICPILNGVKQKDKLYPEVYASWNKDEKVRINSTSGGIFSALAKVIIEKGGVVVGAYYDENFDIKHGIINAIEEIGFLRQSKYAQSNLGDVFYNIREILLEKKIVLFCGTPCQSAGLQNFLGKEYSNLYCCDFICRGVISPKVYKKFLVDMSCKQNSALKTVHFKNKDFGWNRFSTKLLYEDGSFYQKDRDDDYYMRGYLKYNLYLRPSCHGCHYKSMPRISDISLGDFWGIGNYDDKLDNNQGTSVVLVNSSKGKHLFEWVKSELYYETRQLDEVLAGNTCLLNSAPQGQYRAYFFENMDKYSFDKLIEKIDEKVLNLSKKDKVLRLLHSIKLRLLGERK